MSPGLGWLVRRVAVGRLRFVARRFRTVRGALGMGAVAIFAALFLASQWTVLSAGLWRVDPPTLSRYAALGLAMIWALGIFSARGLHFTPAEVGALFPAPLRRRDLLAYYLASRALVQLLSALWIAAYVAPMAPRAGAAVAGVLLGMLFVFLATQAVALARVRVEGRWGGWPFHVLLAAVVAAPAWGLARAYASARAGVAPGRVLAAAIESPGVRALTLPFRPFAELVAASTPGAALAWGAASAALCAALAWGLLRADVPFEERALEHSHRLNERLARMRADGWLAGSAPARRTGARVPVPALAFLGGAAPLARRHLLEAARSPRMLGTAMLLYLLMAGGLILAPLLDAARGDAPADGGERTMIFLGLALAPVFTMTHLRLDFRRDLDRMPYLKSLPLSPWTMAVGQIFPTVALFSGVHAVAVLAAAAALGLPAGQVAALLVAVPVLLWGLSALDNTLFLLLPYRPPVPGASETAFGGRTLLVGVLKVLALLVMAGAAALAGWLASWAAAGSFAAAAAGAGAVLAATAAALTWSTAAAFHAFDASRDVPA